MKALGKILGLLLLGLLLLLVALGLALTHLFNPNDYKDEISQLARDKAGVELRLQGDIGWSLFPWLGLELSDATIASLQQPEQPLARVRLLGLSVRVMPLLRREVQMSAIRVDGLELDLQRDAQGRGNWQQLGQAQTATPSDSRPATGAQPASPPPAAPQSSAQTVRLDIDSLTLSNARIRYQDLASGQQYSLEGIQLSTGAITEGQSIPIKLSGFFANNQPVLRAKAELSGKLRFERSLQRYQLEDLQLQGEASGEPLQGKTLTFSSQGQLLLDQAAQIAEWSSFKLSANQLRAIGELRLRELDKGGQLEGGLSLAPFNLREFLSGLGIELPAMNDAGALEQFELSARLSGNSQSLNLQDLKLRLDDSRFTGQIAVSDWQRQALRLQLQGDRLDLDRYLPPKAAEQPSQRQGEVREALARAGSSGTSELPGAPTQQAWSQSEMLPLARLRPLDLQASLSLGQLNYDGLPLRNLQLQLHAKQGRLTLKQLRSELFDGRLEATGEADLREQPIRLSLNKTLSRLPLEQLFKAQGESLPLRGRLDLQAQLTTQGNSQQAWVDALNGDMRFAVLDGVLLDANLEQQLCQGIATLNRQPLSNPPSGRDTPFQRLDGSLRIRNGVANNPDLQVRLPGLSVKGQGDIDLRVLGMDYRAGITLEGDQREMPDPACQVNERYQGIEWPLRCRGPLELGGKACRLDKDGLGKIAARLAGSKLTEKLEEKLGDKVSPELKDALRGLFKQ